jgi:prepilin-type N-terminal cleavage/methylation domain-containing protein
MLGETEDSFFLTRASARRAPGFTLVELLVVIAIIGILAAMILPVFVRVKTQAKMKLAAIEMSQFGNAIASYENANNQYPVSTAVKNAAAAANEDSAYGGVFKGPTGGPVTVMTPGLPSPPRRSMPRWSAYCSTSTAPPTRATSKTRSTATMDSAPSG